MTEELEDVRKPLPGAAHYDGNVLNNINWLMPMGPNYMGEWMYPLRDHSEYDPVTDKTTLRFSLQPPTVNRR